MDNEPPDYPPMKDSLGLRHAVMNNPSPHRFFLVQAGIYVFMILFVISRARRVYACTKLNCLCYLPMQMPFLNLHTYLPVLFWQRQMLVVLKLLITCDRFSVDRSTTSYILFSCVLAMRFTN